MAEETYPIKGIPLIPGQDIPVRREITDWYEDENSRYQVSLFIQSLTILMTKPIEERLSYFQIAGISSRDVDYVFILANLKGIHSYPCVGWDGVKACSSGYCAHNTVTFPTWHRPYMLLYEVSNIMLHEPLLLMSNISKFYTT